MTQNSESSFSDTSLPRAPSSAIPTQFKETSVAQVCPEPREFADRNVRLQAGLFVSSRP